MQRYDLFFLIAIITVLVSGCSTESQVTYSPSNQIKTDENARVIITTDFGKNLILDQTVDANISVMSALNKVADVETKFGGGFVHDINELRQATDYNGDWLLYVNGIQTKTGAVDYTLLPGDSAQWDFHDWDFRMFTPATIGMFPAPFRYGYAGKVYPTYIVHEPEFQDTADKCAAKLLESGIEAISLSQSDEITEEAQETGNVILIGNMSSKLISELNDIWDRTGFFVHFENNQLVIFDDEGDQASRLSEGVGIIQATQNPWNSKGIGACENVVWIVSGVDDAGVQLAVDALVDRYEDFSYAFAAIVTSEGVVPVPPGG